MGAKRIERTREWISKWTWCQGCHMHWRWVEDLEVDKLNEVLSCINYILDEARGSGQYMNKLRVCNPIYVCLGRYPRSNHSQHGCQPGLGFPEFIHQGGEERLWIRLTMDTYFQRSSDSKKMISIQTQDFHLRTSTSIHGQIHFHPTWNNSP